MVGRCHCQTALGDADVIGFGRNDRRYRGRRSGCYAGLYEMVLGIECRHLFGISYIDDQPLTVGERIAAHCCEFSWSNDHLSKGRTIGKGMGTYGLRIGRKGDFGKMRASFKCLVG